MVNEVPPLAEKERTLNDEFVRIWDPHGDAFPWEAWPRDAAVDRHKQAGRQSTALTGASLLSCHVTKRFRILATLKQG